jgi:hypothetical protein
MWYNWRPYRRRRGRRMRARRRRCKWSDEKRKG